MVRLSRVAPAREVLRAKGRTRQAGFTAERIPVWLFRHRPILIDDGPEHDEHRRQLARFFAPRVLAERHGQFITDTARAAVGRARGEGSCGVDKLVLHYSVEVAAHIVGLTESKVPRLARRLTRFFRQPPVDHTRADYGRTNRDWIRAARNALGPLVSFYFADVRPAVRARRRRPTDDIITHLLERGYRTREILMECLTYGTAGMVTTREFISAALWHLLEDPELAERFLREGQAGRSAILNEIIRLEPPVGHLYRRLTEDVQVSGSECPYPAGALVDIDVRTANLDVGKFGEDAARLCPSRELPRADQAGLSFGDGAHRCPGSPLAMAEAEAVITELLTAGAAIAQPPTIEWDSLIEGYQLRGFTLKFPEPSQAGT